MIQCRRVRVRGGIGIGECLGRSLHRRCGGRAPGAPRDVAGHGLPRDPFVLLGQPADERVRRGGAHRPGQRFEITGEDAQQGALPGTVGPDDTDHIAGRHGQIDVLEQCAMGVSAGHILRDKRCGHGLIITSTDQAGLNRRGSSHPSFWYRCRVFAPASTARSTTGSATITSMYATPKVATAATVCPLNPSP